VDDPDDRIGLEDVPSIADERWLVRNGDDTVLPPIYDSWQPINLAELPEQAPVQPTLGGLGIAYPGKRHVFSGPQESAKTLAAYILAIKLAHAEQTAVLIDFEMGRWDARNRLRELGATPDDLRRIQYVEPAEPANAHDIGRLLALEPQLVIIDAAAGAYDLQGLDDNRRSDVERFTSIYVKGFWLAEIATIVLDHVVKTADNRGTYAIGSERKVGGADVHLGFETILPVKRGSHGKYKIVTHKDRMGFLRRGKLAELDLTSDGETHEITWAFTAATDEDEEDFRPTNLMEKVSHWLERNRSSAPHSYKTIISEVRGRDQFIRVAIGCLVEEGYATQEDGPRESKLVTSVKPFTESLDVGPPRPDVGPAEVTQPRPTSAPYVVGAGLGGRAADDATSAQVENGDDEFPF
jgi:hypothetical protein